MKLRTIAQSGDLLITHNNGNGIFFVSFSHQLRIHHVLTYRKHPIQTQRWSERIRSGNSSSYNLYLDSIQTLRKVREQFQLWHISKFTFSHRLQSLTSVITYYRNFNFDAIMLHTLAQSGDLISNINENGFFGSFWWHCSGSSCTSLGNERE